MWMTWILVLGFALGWLLALPSAQPSSTPAVAAPTKPTSVDPTLDVAKGTLDSVLKGTPSAWLISLAQWTANATQDKLIESLAPPPSSLTPLEWRVLLIRWAEFDPEHFIENAMGLVNVDAPYSEDLVWSILAEVDLKLAAVQAKAKKHIIKAQDRDSDDPAGMVAWLESTELDQQTRENLLPGAYKSWIKKDRVAAMQSIDALPDNDFKKKLMAVAAGVWAHKDPDAAYAWAMEITEFDIYYRPVVLRGIFDALQEEGGRDAAWNFLKAHSDPFPIDLKSASPDKGSFYANIRNIIQRAAYTDPGAVIAWIGTLKDPGDQGRMIRNTTALSIHLTDPNPWIALLPEGRARETLAAQIIGRHHSHVKDQIAQVQALESADRVRFLTNILIGSLFQPDGVAATFDQWKHLADRDNVIDRTVKVWAREYPAAATAWLSELPEDLVSPTHFNIA
jgi:hypothetical protein